MGTVIEGEYAQVMGGSSRCFEAMSRDCDRVECIMRFDYRKDRQGMIRGKVASVERRLGREVREVDAVACRYKWITRCASAIAPFARAMGRL